MRDGLIYGNAVTRSWAKLIVVLLPFWTLPFLPGSFRPISIFLLIPISVLYITNNLLAGKIHKEDLTLLLFMFLGILQSIFLQLLYGGSFAVWLIGIASFAIGLISYFGFKSLLVALGLHRFLKLMRISVFVFVVVGWIDTLGWAGLLPSSIREYLNLALAGKSGGRLMITTSEPALACAAISMLLPFAYYFYTLSKNKLDKFCVISMVLFFVIAFSVYGIFIVLLTLAVWMLIKLRLSVIMKSAAAIAIVSLGAVLVFNFIADSGSYYVSRVSKLAALDSVTELTTLDNLAAVDGSSFIRIGYPVIAYQIFTDFPLGIGVGRYGSYFPDYVGQYGGLITSNPQVVQHVEESTAHQHNFYLKVLTESGIFISILLFYFYYRSAVIAYALMNSKNNQIARFGTILVVSLILMFANMSQFATYLFPTYWLVPALIFYFNRLTRTSVNSGEKRLEFAK